MRAGRENRVSSSTEGRRRSEEVACRTTFKRCRAPSTSHSQLLQIECGFLGQSSPVRCGHSLGWRIILRMAPERFRSWLAPCGYMRRPCTGSCRTHNGAPASSAKGRAQRFRPYAIGRGAQAGRAGVGAIRAATGRQRLDGARLGPLHVFWRPVRPACATWGCRSSTPRPTHRGKRRCSAKRWSPFTAPSQQSLRPTIYRTGAGRRGRRYRQHAGGELARYPGPRGILFDRPHVVSDAPRLLKAWGVAERVTIEFGDFFVTVPAGGDVYILSHIIHDWKDEQCLAILANCRNAL